MHTELAPEAGATSSPAEQQQGAPAPNPAPRLIGDIVVELGYASRGAVEAAVTVARVEGKPTGRVLLESGVLRAEQLAHVLSERFGVEHVDLPMCEIDPQALGLLELDAIRRYEAVPVRFLENGEVQVVMADPSNVLTVDDITMITGRRIRRAVSSAEDIAVVIARYSELARRAPQAGGDGPAAPADGDAGPRPDGLAVADGASTPADTLATLLGLAVTRGATAIHCDPSTDENRVALRCDGVLAGVGSLTPEMAQALVSHVKTQAGLALAPKPMPQSGRLVVNLDGNELELRVTTLPVLAGEALTLHVLDGTARTRDLAGLGLSTQARGAFEQALSRRGGLVLVAGRGGSGRTTTLYAAIDRLADAEHSVVTVESPIEYPLPGVNQVPVRSEEGVTFTVALESALASDPDSVVIGELRERAVAQLAVEAALGGPQMLAALRAPDAASAALRLVDLGVDPFQVASSLECVVSQRLLRRLCPSCRRPAQLTPAEREEHGLSEGRAHEAVGCPECTGTGYHGRVGVYEVMLVTDEIRTLLSERRGAGEIRELARREGMVPLKRAAIEHVADGVTSLAEAARVAHL